MRRFLRGLIWSLVLALVVACGDSVPPAQPSIRVLTLNTWLLPFFAKHTEDRLKIMPEMISGTRADVVFFQEVWGEGYRNKLMEGMRAQGYAHQTFRLHPTGSGMAKENGLLIASRLPLGPETELLSYSVSTRFDESLVKKGAIRAKLLVPGSPLGSIDIYNTHLGAMTFDAKKGIYDEGHERSRGRQQDELIAFVRRSRQSPAMILAGDLNQHWLAIENGRYTDRMTATYQLLVGSRGGLGLIDSYRAFVTSNTSLPAPVRHGFTTDVGGNPYCDNPLDPALKNQPSVVDDYIFIDNSGRLAVTDSRIVFDKPIAAAMQARLRLRELPLRLTDHYGVLTTVTPR